MTNQSTINRMYFDVQKVKRFDYDDMKEKNYIVNTENNMVLSEVSERYCLVKNEDIFKPIIDHFGVTNVKTSFGYGNNKYYFVSINTGRQFNLGTTTNPDLIDERIIIQNSYNKSRSFSFMYGAFRYVCSNGLYTGKANIAYKKIHVGKIPIDDIVNNVINNFDKNNFECFYNMANKPLSLEDQIKVLCDIKPFEVKEDNYYDINNKIRRKALRFLNAPTSADNRRDVFGLYNQINRAINYWVNGKSNISRKINANLRVESQLIDLFNLN